MKIYKYILYIIMALVFMFFAFGCAAGANPVENTAATDGEIAGFWLGLWHGLICPITFIISLFSDKIHFYEVHNNGGWYNAGYVLGVLIILGGGGSGTRTVRRREKVVISP